jgi:hypothetical protein
VITFIVVGQHYNGWWFSPQIINAESREIAAVKYRDPKTEESPTYVWVAQAPASGQFVESHSVFFRYRIVTPPPPPTPPPYAELA